MSKLNSIRERLSRVLAPWNYRKRAYLSAAKGGSMLGNWLGLNASIDQITFSDLETVRARSRDIVLNNEFAINFLRLSLSNIVGHDGFTLMSKAKTASGEEDHEASDRIESAWEEWSTSKFCSMTGRDTFHDIQRIMHNHFAIDGEAFVRGITGSKVNKFGYSLDVINPAYIDLRHNQDLSNGTFIRMGVELDLFRRPIRYWLRDPKANDLHSNYGNTLESLPAESVFHLYEEIFTNQTRGIPPIAVGLSRLKVGADFEQTTAVATRASASKMGFYVKRSQSGYVPRDLKMEEPTAHRMIQELRPGMIEIVEDGYEFQGFDPKFPHENFTPFMKYLLMAIGSGWGINYSHLTNDYEGVTFSSLRDATLRDIAVWKMKHRLFANRFLVNVFDHWLLNALSNNAIPGLSIRDYERCKSHKWFGKTFPWIDPEKDVNATIMAINSGLTTLTDELAKNGRDIRDIIKIKKKEKEMAEEAGVILNSETLNYIEISKGEEVKK